jgi:uncharacterized pyridoxal phosphate-containing UPF0001 family protein
MIDLRQSVRSPDLTLSFHSGDPARDMARDADSSTDMQANLASLRCRITAACERAGRDPSSVTLLAVSKGHPPETVKAAAALGLDCFGENRMQEAKAKIPLCPGRLHWHMIGHLQSNKARDAAHWFELIHGVDRLDLATELDKWSERAGKTTRILLEGRDSRAHDHGALDTRTGEGAAGVSTVARVEATMRRLAGCAVATLEHGDEWRL